MCGIAGIFNCFTSRDELGQRGNRMLNSLKHRGPDAYGHWISEPDGLLLGHRRLAIQDLSEFGAQPMFSMSRRYCVVFNGEIYNFQELKNELKQHGCIFRGGSDSEVLIEAIDLWGLVPALKKFVGMFAFALWDIKEKKLHLCRDRVGEKPLYYGVIGKNLYFSSELKAIECVVAKSKLSIDRIALNGFLRHGYINAPYSIYKNIFKLLPGSVLSIRKADIDNAQLASPVPFWSILDIANRGLNTQIQSEDDGIEQLDALLKKTIRRQLVADVNVGTFLSGGIDSSLVSAIAQQEATHQIKTFTIGFREAEYDESSYARKVAEHIGSSHQEIFVSSGDALNVIPDLSKIYDEPFADSSQIPTYLVSRIAKQQVTVCLSGDGGDELFAGYNRYMWLSQIWSKVSVMPVALRKIVGRVLSIPSPYIWDRLYAFVGMLNRDKNNHKLLGLKMQKLAGLLQQESIYSGYNYLVSYWNEPNSLLTKDFCGEFSTLPRKFPSTTNFIEEAMYWDQVSYLPGDNLAKVDRASMYVSLETRLPLISHEVIEYSWRLPLHLKIKENRSKYLLRKVLDRYVPNELIDRPKMGFSVPVSKWLQSDLKEWAEDLLFSQSICNQEIFRMGVLKKIWNEHISGQYDHSHRLWTVLMFLSWRLDR